MVRQATTKAKLKATKPPPPQKPAPKCVTKPNSSLPTAPKKRKAFPDKSDLPTPEWDKGVTSKAQREKRRFKLSMSSLSDPISEEDLAKMAAALTGSSRNTWGLSTSAPIKGSRRPVKRARPSLGGRSIRTSDSFAEIDRAYAAMMKDMLAGERKKMGVNCPSKSRLLGLSLEVRERIWGWLLRYPKPIMVKGDWTTVERNPFVDHGVMLVCKQFADECTRFLFKHNSFVSLLRVPSPQARRRYEEHVSISTEALSMYRNIILDCAPECWNMNWFEKAAHGLQRLVDAKARIESLTLRFMPRKVRFSSTAKGMEESPITFADFLWYDGDFMRAVCALAPKRLVVIIRKEGRVKLAIEVDMKDMKKPNPVKDVVVIEDMENSREIEEVIDNKELKDSLLAYFGVPETQESQRLAEEKASDVTSKLMSLEEIYKEIFANHAKVVTEGKCRLLEQTVVQMAGLSLLKSQSPTQGQCHTLGSDRGSAVNFAPPRDTPEAEISADAVSDPDITPSATPEKEIGGTVDSQSGMQEPGGGGTWVFGLPGSIEERMKHL